LPPLYARPRHAAPRTHAKVKAALVPAVLVASTGSALGGLAVSASAESTKTAVVAASNEVDRTLLAVDVEAEQLELARAREAVRASRDRQRGEAKAAELAAAAEAARVAEEARKAAEAAKPKYARPGTGRITSAFGPRWGRLHTGLDIAAGMGAPIMAAAAGTVISSGNEGGYGYAVRIQHPDGTTTLYAHNSRLLVRAGQKVEAGQQIAKEGSSGNSTGPHVHFEVRIGGKPIDPRDWLRDRGVNI